MLSPGSPPATLVNDVLITREAAWCTDSFRRRPAQGPCRSGGIPRHSPVSDGPPPAFLAAEHVRGDMESFLAGHGEIFAVFAHQDSGCRGYGVETGGRRYFLKASVEARAIPSLQRAIALHRVVRHDTLIPLLGAATTDTGLLLAYPWVDGEVLYGAPVSGRPQRLDPAGPHARFRALPVSEILAALDAIFDAHLVIAAAGIVAVDLYDGCLIYDVAAHRIWLCDLDEYRVGPFVVSDDRLPGSTRFMAPEELQRGARVDQRTTVFNLGRMGLVLLDTGDLDGRFRAGPGAHAVLEQATRARPVDRYTTVEDFVCAWRGAGD